LTLHGLVQLFLFLNFVASKIKPYYDKISTIQSQNVINALTDGGLWHAHKGVPRNQPDDEDDDEDNDRGEGGPGGPSGRGSRGGGGGGGRGHGGGNGGLSKEPVLPDRKHRSHDVTAPKATKVRRVNEDVAWESTLSEWNKDTTTAIRDYGKPAPLTANSLSALPRIPKPHLGVETEGVEGICHYPFLVQLTNLFPLADNL
jgi:hypothetical protein